MPVYMLRCSLDLARKLGMQPLKREGFFFRPPTATIILDIAKNEGSWHWPLDQVLKFELRDRGIKI